MDSEPGVDRIKVFVSLPCREHHFAPVGHQSVAVGQIAYGYGLTEWNVAAAVGERFVNGEIVEFGIAAFGEKTVEREEGIACTLEGFSLIGDHHSAANVIETLSVGAVAELRPFVLEVACYSQVQFRLFKRLLDGCVGSKVIEAYDRAVVFYLNAYPFIRNVEQSETCHIAFLHFGCVEGHCGYGYRTYATLGEGVFCPIEIFGRK